MKLGTVSHTSVLKCLIRKFAFKCFYFVQNCKKSHLWCSRSKMTGLRSIAYKSVIMLYYHQILDSIFLSTCFLSFRTGFVFLFASD